MCLGRYHRCVSLRYQFVTVDTYTREHTAMAEAIAPAIVENVDVIANVGYTSMAHMVQAVIILISLIILFVGLILLCYGKYFDGGVWFAIGALGLGGTIYWIQSSKSFSDSASQIRASRQSSAPAYQPNNYTPPPTSVYHQNAYMHPNYSYPAVSYAPQSHPIHPGYTNPFYYHVARGEGEDTDIPAAAYLPSESHLRSRHQGGD
jgi:hypothetical protein